MSGRASEPTLGTVPLEGVAGAAVLVAFSAVDPLAGLGGGVLVGACLVALGALPAFAVGQLVLAGLTPQPIVVVAVLQALLLTLLLRSTLAMAAPGRLVAAAVSTLGASGLVATVAWLWTASVPVTTLAMLGTLGTGLYAVYRYGTIAVGSVTT